MPGLGRFAEDAIARAGQLRITNDVGCEQHPLAASLRGCQLQRESPRELHHALRGYLRPSAHLEPTRANQD